MLSAGISIDGVFTESGRVGLSGSRTGVVINKLSTDIEEVSAGTTMLLSKLSLCSEVSPLFRSIGVSSVGSVSFISVVVGVVGCSLVSKLSSLIFSFIIFTGE